MGNKKQTGAAHIVWHPARKSKNFNSKTELVKRRKEKLKEALERKKKREERKKAQRLEISRDRINHINKQIDRLADDVEGLAGHIKIIPKLSLNVIPKMVEDLHKLTIDLSRSLAKLKLKEGGQNEDQKNSSPT